MCESSSFISESFYRFLRTHYKAVIEVEKTGKESYFLHFSAKVMCDLSLAMLNMVQWGDLKFVLCGLVRGDDGWVISAAISSFYGAIPR